MMPRLESCGIPLFMPHFQTAHAAAQDDQEEPENEAQGHSNSMAALESTIWLPRNEANYNKLQTVASGNTIQD